MEQSIPRHRRRTRAAPLRAPLLAGALSLLAVGSATGQQAGLVLDVRGGATIPLGSFADGTRVGQGTEPGSSLFVAFVLPRTPRRSLYFGFAQHRFGCEPAGCPADEPYVATGFDVGVRVAILPESRVTPWVGVGAVTTRVETYGLPAPDTGLSKLGFGGEGTLGLSFETGGALSVVPSVTATVVGSDLPGGARLNLRFLVAHLGLALAF